MSLMIDLIDLIDDLRLNGILCISEMGLIEQLYSMKTIAFTDPYHETDAASRK